MAYSMKDTNSKNDDVNVGVKKYPKDNVFIVSLEGDRFSIPIKAAELSKTLKIELEAKLDDENYNSNVTKHDNEIELVSSQQGRINSKTLNKISTFLSHYVTKEKMEYFKSPFQEGSKLEDIVQPTWYAEFIVEIRKDSNILREKNEFGEKKNLLFDIVLAADFLDIQPLLRLAVLAVSFDINGRSVEELQQIFNIKIHDSNERKAIQQENNWAMKAKEKMMNKLESKSAIS